MKINITVLILLFFVFLFNSCDTPLSLGEQLNLEPPVVTITEPHFMKNISADEPLKISGTASDLSEVVLLNITIETTIGEWKREIRSERGNWRTLGTSNDTPLGGWQATRGEVKWHVYVCLQGAPDGEYLISVNAVNNVNNAGPIQQRRVIIDNQAPLVVVLLPELVPNDGDHQSTLDDFKPRNFSIIDRLHSQNITVQFEVRDNISVYQVYFELWKENADSAFFVHDAGSSWSSNFEIDAADLPITRTYFLLKSRASDLSGNEDVPAPRAHGWFVWDPAANTPWSEGIGSEDEPQDLNNNTPQDVPTIFPGMAVGGLAYDNTGVRSISYTITGLGAADSYNRSGTQVNETESRSFSFNITAPVNPGYYRITVVTEDINGYTGSDDFYFFVFDTETGPLLLNFRGSSNPGTYGPGDTITIVLNLRSSVTVSGAPYLVLSNSAHAVFNPSASSGNRMVFNFTVDENHNTNGAVLEITSLSIPQGTTIISGSVNLTEEVRAINFTERPLSDATAIFIDAGLAALIDAVINESTLLLTFSRRVSRGDGNITLIQQGTLLAPAVLLPGDLNRFGPRHPQFYERGTNGTIQEGNTWARDLSEKYVLRFDVEPYNIDLINALTNAGAFRIEIPVTSPVVNFNDNTVTINLTGGLAPRVRGVNYLITFDAGTIMDSVHRRAVTDFSNDSTRTVNVTGVNDPVIRVRRDQRDFDTRSFTDGTIHHHVVAVQQYQTEVRIDTQTPDATINYAFARTVTPPVSSFASLPAVPTVSFLDTLSQTGNTFTIGDSNAASPNRNGLLYGIVAQASLSGVNSNLVREIAARSVIQYTNFYATVNVASNANSAASNLRVAVREVDPREVLQLWITGGDNDRMISNTTPGFPLLGQAHMGNARLFTNAEENFDTGNGNGVWYWISWDLNDTAFFHFQAGTTMTATTNNQTVLENDARLGPRRWSPAREGWANRQNAFPLHPGGSLSMNSGSNVPTPAGGTFRFNTSFEDHIRPGL